MLRGVGCSEKMQLDDPSGQLPDPPISRRVIGCACVAARARRKEITTFWSIMASELCSMTIPHGGKRLSC